RVCETEGLVLQNVFDFYAPAFAVTDAFFDVVAGLGADDDADFFNTGTYQSFDAVKQNWFVGDGQELLSRGVGDWSHSGAFAAAQDQTFHTGRMLFLRLGHFFSIPLIWWCFLVFISCSSVVAAFAKNCLDGHDDDFPVQPVVPVVAVPFVHFHFGVIGQ